MDALPPQVVEIWDISREMAIDYLVETSRSPALYRIVMEPVARDRDGVPYPDSGLNLPTRHDFIATMSDGTTETFYVSTDHYLHFEPMEFAYRGVTITQHPFVWTEVTITVSGTIGPPLNPRLKRWYLAHLGELDAEHDHTPAEVVHYMSEPAYSGDHLVLEVDFGSANIKALTDLLDLLIETGAREIDIVTDMELE